MNFYNIPIGFGIVRSEKEMYALVAFLANGTVQ